MGRSLPTRLRPFRVTDNRHPDRLSRRPPLWSFGPDRDLGGSTSLALPLECRSRGSPLTIHEGSSWFRPAPGAFGAFGWIERAPRAPIQLPSAVAPKGHYAAWGYHDGTVIVGRRGESVRRRGRLQGSPRSGLPTQIGHRIKSDPVAMPSPNVASHRELICASLGTSLLRPPITSSVRQSPARGTSDAQALSRRPRRSPSAFPTARLVSWSRDGTGHGSTPAPNHHQQSGAIRRFGVPLARRFSCARAAWTAGALHDE